MKRLAIVKGVAAGLACFGMLMPAHLLAAAPEKAANPSQGGPRIMDVTLHQGGVLVGQLVSPQGQPQANRKVALAHNGSELVQVTTDANGMFAVKGLQGGVYHLLAGSSTGTYRAWSEGTAPPVARPGALLVDSQSIVRGQCGSCGQSACGGGCGGYAGGCATGCCGGGPFGGGLSGMLSNPVILGAIIATAIAVPIALSSDS